MMRKVTIVSLSRGILGEPFVRHEVELGLARLRERGLSVTFSEHALRGERYLAAHPEARADDLLSALRDPHVDLILCAIGGLDAYRMLPHLFEHGELADAAAASDKAFLGFSDTTTNHLMLHKVGLGTFYGQAFPPDICELGPTMLPYTASCFDELVRTRTIREVTPSDVWYDARTDFSPDAVGTTMASHRNQGFVLLQGPPRFSGKVLGGCIDTLHDYFDGGRHADAPRLCERYGLFPMLDDWAGRILLLETSENQPTPERYRAMLVALKATGVFGVVSGLLVGKPMGERYAPEYERALVEVIDDPGLPVVCNVNVGHATPRCIIPFGVDAHVDVEGQRIAFG